MKKQLYVAGAYSAPTLDEVIVNVKAAEKVGVKYIKKGYSVVIPHKNTFGVESELSYDTILESCLGLVEHSDIIVMLPGWEQSNGALKEHALAKERGIEVWYE